ncbi:MAG: GDP-L-fucose synthase [Candidatus Omnitrophica bacterium]|nr:GDP-L-fucose synthase [Candidatus Omnitrophota bacterium]
MRSDATIYVAGQTTLLGAAIVRALKRQRCLLIEERDPDFSDRAAVDAFLRRTSPEAMIIAAGASGGIHANQAFPAEFMQDNLLVACHLIDSAYRHGVGKLLYLGSSCSYPKHCPQPMRIESLLTGPLEPTNAPYAVAKLAGMTLCQAYRQQFGAMFIVGIPGDAFGPGDDFHPDRSHVIASLIRKMHEAKEGGAASVEVWGTGRPRRGFIFADDLASACLFVLRAYEGAEPINIAGDWDVSIKDVAELIKEVVGFSGALQFNASKPDGIPVKVLDGSRLYQMGWRPRHTIREALSATYQWFVGTQQEMPAVRSGA